MAESQEDHEVFRLQYEATRVLFEVDLQGCISAARRNLHDPALPTYYVIKNSILMACALDDWRDADIYRINARDIYYKSLSIAESNHDEEALEGDQEDIDAMDDEMDDIFPVGYEIDSEDNVQHDVLDGAAEDGAAKEAPTETAEAAERTSPVNATTLAPPLLQTCFAARKALIVRAVLTMHTSSASQSMASERRSDPLWKRTGFKSREPPPQRTKKDRNGYCGRLHIAQIAMTNPM
ncbi:hypothetical protein ST47_g5878 [Ascochyta rabiei]|uniref:Uncharacterized protein n=1 Tax=Didymella rabiei TaxID=5454 RepID=A0A163D7W4_DIDRA|nr:hypothetical protein ST47_g5878 [Ascochyta rabiei]